MRLRQGPLHINKYIFFFPPAPQRGEELCCQRIWQPPRHTSK